LRSPRLIAAAVAVSLAAGGGAAFATVKLVSSHPSEGPPAATGFSASLEEFGLGGRLGGRGLDGGLAPGGPDGQRVNAAGAR
jgi:hypothetical protein